MRTYLLPKAGQFYKANLHCHSTVSDGKYTPEELKQRYIAEGYSAIAYTDHHLMIPHHELTDENFVALTGWEFGVSELKKDALDKYGWDNIAAKKTHIDNCDICLIAPNPDVVSQTCYQYDDKLPDFMKPYQALVQYDPNEPEFDKNCSVESINELVRRHREKGYFVTLNHPGFSLIDYPKYTRFEGFNALEICNFGSVITGHPDYNEKEYDDLLRVGKRISCIATDDNHNYNRYKPEVPDDSFGGFTMIKAEKLEYTALVDALKAGNMYASQGPLIQDLYIEDGKLHITCSDAERIVLNTAGRRCAAAVSTNSIPLNSADFLVQPEDEYIRITITDFRGRKANTRAYFTDEIL